ncbi:hypothetical protein [Streptomyces bobili]|uniref:hypothetical protein n=1 Tax=Streptomyces bobili TaxID=67280 RepID=UPI003827ABC9
MPGDGLRQTDAPRLQTTCAEVLIHEAVDPPAIGPGRRLTSGAWWSYYDATA